MTEQQICDLLAQMFRVGFVVGRQPERMRVMVEFRDTTTARLVSDWLPVLTPLACGDEEYDLPDEGDQVLCVFLAFGLEQGFVLGAMYGKGEPPVVSGDKWHRRFRDGTVLEYDRAAHRLFADVKGDVEAAVTGNVTAAVQGNINVTVKGGMTASAQGAASVSSAAGIALNAPAISMGSGGGGGTEATVTGNTRQRGSITVESGDVTVNGISFLRHVHICPHGGETGVPQ